MKRFLSKLKRDPVYPYFGTDLQEQLEYDQKRNKVREIPYILYQFLEYFDDDEGIFRTSGSMKMVKQMREDMDKNGTVDFKKNDVPVAVITSLMKSWLRQLKDGVVPKEFYMDFLNFKDRPLEVRKVIERLPVVNLKTLRTICEFLKKVTGFAQYNKMVITNISIVFGPCLFRCPSDDGTDSPASMEFMSESMKTSQFVKILLENFGLIFEEKKQEPVRLQSAPVPSVSNTPVPPQSASLPIPKSKSIDSVSSLTDPPREVSAKDHQKINILVQQAVDNFIQAGKRESSQGIISPKVLESPGNQEFPKMNDEIEEIPEIPSQTVEAVQTPLVDTPRVVTVKSDTSSKSDHRISFQVADVAVENGTIISKSATSSRIDEVKLKIDSSNFDGEPKPLSKPKLHQSSPALNEISTTNKGITSDTNSSSAADLRKLYSVPELKPPNRPPPPTPLVQSIPTPITKKQSLKSIPDLKNEEKETPSPLVDRKPLSNIKPPNRPAPPPPMSNSRHSLAPSTTKSTFIPLKDTSSDIRPQPPQLTIMNSNNQLLQVDSISPLNSFDTITHNQLKQDPNSRLKSSSRQSFPQVKSVEVLPTPSSPIAPLKTPLTPNYSRKLMSTTTTTLPDFPSSPTIDTSHLESLISTLQNIPFEYISQDQIKQVKEMFKTLHEKTPKSEIEQGAYKSLKRLIKGWQNDSSSPITPSIPKNVDTMTKEEIVAEKSKLKKELSVMKETFASRLKNGETVSKLEKQTLKAMYDWYLKLKERAVEQEETKWDELKKRKKELQVELYQFQIEFKQKHGYAVQSPEDMEPMKQKYKEYKVSLSDVVDSKRAGAAGI